MKKTLSALCLLVVLSLSAAAQDYHPRHRYQPRRAEMRAYERPAPRFFNPYGELRFLVFGELGRTDLGAIFRHEVPYHFAIGGLAEYQVGRITSIGVGAEFYSSYGQHCNLFHNMQETYIHTLPLYANVRLALPNAPVSPFIEGRIGYSLPLGRVTCNDPEGVHHYRSSGLYTGGAVGLKIYRTYLSFGLSTIDVVDADFGFIGPKIDAITDYYVRVSFAF